MFFQARLFNVAKIVYTLLHYSFPSNKSSAWNENAYTWQTFFLNKKLPRSKQVSTTSIPGFQSCAGILLLTEQMKSQENSATSESPHWEKVFPF